MIAAGKARARLVPLAQSARKGKPGRLKHLFKMHDNFDDPLPPDIAEASEWCELANRLSLLSPRQNIWATEQPARPPPR